MPNSILASSSRPTLKQWFEGPVIEVLRTSESLGWSEGEVSSSRMHPPGDWYTAPLTDDYFLMALMNGKTRTQWSGAIEHKDYDHKVASGALFIYPPQFSGRAIWESPITAAYVQIPLGLLAKLADGAICGDPERVSLGPRFNFADPFLFALVHALCGELYQPAPLGPLYADSIAHTIALHVLGRYSNAALAANTVCRRLSAAQVRLLTEYIHEHLDQKLSLSELAACIHVSVSHFERLFRTSFGHPPYRYVLERRIERAQLLLCSSKLSLYEIARACGFANQSHFTRHFSRFMGISPAQFVARSNR